MVTTACSPVLFAGRGGISGISHVRVPSAEMKEMCLLSTCSSA